MHEMPNVSFRVAVVGLCIYSKTAVFGLHSNECCIQFINVKCFLGKGFTSLIVQFYCHYPV